MRHMLPGSIACHAEEELPPMLGVKFNPTDVHVEDRSEPHIPKPSDTHQRRAVKVLLRP
jgi:hypothetical protein